MFKFLNALFILLQAIIYIAFAFEVSASEKIIKSHGYAAYSNLKYPANFAHFDYVNPNAPKGGELKMAHVGTFDSVNANILKGTKAPGLDYIYDALMVNSFDELNSYYGLVAESIEYPESLSWVIFNMRKEAKWHDGSLMTADDLIFSFNTLKEKGNPNYKIVLADITKVEKLDDYRVKYTFASSHEPLLISIIGELPIIQKKFFQDKAFDQFEEVYPTSGPYRIKNYSHGKFITFERVKDYWGKDLPVFKGVYNFDIIHYDVYRENTIAVEALKAGDFDFREENISQVWATAYSGKDFDNGSLIKEAVPHKLPANLQALFLNMRKDALKDIALRKAIFYAYDFDWMNKNLFYSIYTRTKSYFDNTVYAASGLPQGEELKVLKRFENDLPKEVFEKEFITPTTNSNIMKNRVNLKIAKQILLDAGYQIVGDKMISPITKKPVELEIIYHFQGFERLLLALKENLAKIGITLNLRLIDYAQYLLRMNSFDYDIIIAAFTPTTFPGRNQMQVWHSSSDVKGGYNLSGVRSRVVDELLNNLVNAKDKDSVITYSRALDRVLLWNYYAVPQMHSKNYRIIYWNKFGIPAIRPSYALGVETWWTKQ
ncbi:MAG: extracellular solute-binding protein [Candidatus Jidaibacter sp.]|jgi:microcin C transport system substrate-binding protein|nr:extracellular solute-binding protein [Candidatus Jidaibacter sp.]